MNIPIDYRSYRLEDSFGTWLVHTIRLLHGRFLENLQAAGLEVTIDEWSVLVNLWTRDGVSQQELAACAAKNQPFMTRVLDVLEARNLVMRVPDKTDRRAKQVYLTQQGRVFVQQLIEVAQKTMRQALDGIDEADALFCRDVLARVRRNLAQS